MNKSFRNIINISILLVSPFVLTMIEDQIKKLSDGLMLFKNELGYRLIISALPLLNGIILGLFILLLLVISKKIDEQIKHGFTICILCFILYPIWHLAIWLFFPQLYSFSKSLIFLPLTNNIHLIIAAMVLVVFQLSFLKVKQIKAISNISNS